MAILLSLEFNTVINVSVQVGDIIYYAPTSPIGTTNNAYNTAELVDTIALGKITEIINPYLLNGGISVINILSDLVDVNNDPLPTATPPAGSFIMFGKDKKVNTNSLLGYYARIKLTNDSMDKVELFSVGSEIQQSSK